MRDLRYAVRQLLRAPGFTVAALATLALGIGACVAIFSVVDGVLLRPLPYRDPEGLVVLQEINLPRFTGDFVRPEPYAEWRRQSASFQGLAAVRTRTYNLTGAGEPVRVSAARVTANTFATLGVAPALGRDFAPEEDTAGKGNVVILSHGFWKRQFGARPEVVGQTVALDGAPFTIAGVMPAGFQLEHPLDLYLPAAYVEDAQMRRSVGPHALAVFGRLRPGVTVAGARGEMALIAGRLARQDAEYRDWSVKVTPMREARVGDVGRVLVSLVGAVGFLLLIACANVGNLLLARATARSKEIAIRLALGASRARLLRQLLTESVLLALAGAALGAVAAQWGIGALLALAPDSLPRAQEIALDGRALGVACALALLTGLGFGLAPALHATGARAGQNLKPGGRGDGPRPQRLRGTLVVAEMAIALVLLAGAGLFMRSFVRLQAAERGFRPEGALTFELALSPHRYGEGTDPRLAAFAAAAADRIAAIPGVEAAGASQALPFSVELNAIYFQVAGRPAPVEPPVAHVFECTPGYFPAMGIQLLRGRLFDRHDVAGHQRVGIINQALARRYFGDQDPIGKWIGRPGHLEQGGPIVGVVADVRDGRVAQLDGEAPMQIYVPLAQNPYDVLTFVVRAAPRTDLPAALRAAIHQVDAEQPIGAVRPLADLVAQTTARQRFTTLLFAVFSGAALLLAAIGLYGLMAYLVARRTVEIGIRVALGAQAGNVVAMVLRHSGRLVALGVLLGLGGALALTRSIASLLFGVGPQDPLAFAGAAALLALAGAAACLVPARRAARVDPMTALRSE